MVYRLDWRGVPAHDRVIDMVVSAPDPPIGKINAPFAAAHEEAARRYDRNVMSRASSRLPPMSAVTAATVRSRPPGRNR